MESELRIPNAAAQTRRVSGGPFGRAKESLSRHLKYMAGARISEFESYMPSQPVRSPWVIFGGEKMRDIPAG
jgi:hypothetical protein